MIRDGYLVTTIITWPKQIEPHTNCLVTWEVMGGGLMGSLFTETHDAELSLWPEQKYNIQVTCKNKVSCCILLEFSCNASRWVCTRRPRERDKTKKNA